MLYRPSHLILPRVFFKEFFIILAQGFLYRCLFCNDTKNFLFNCLILKSRQPLSYQIPLKRPCNSAFYSKILFLIWVGMITSRCALPFKGFHVASNMNPTDHLGLLKMPQDAWGANGYDNSDDLCWFVGLFWGYQHTFIWIALFSWMGRDICYSTDGKIRA